MSAQTLIISPDQAGKTLATLLRSLLPGQSWSQVRRVVEGRRVQIGGELCLDSARRLKEGETVEVMARSAPKPRQHEAVTLRYLDGQVVVVEKPAGVCSVRHPAERDWAESRKALSPALEDIVPRLIAKQEGHRVRGPLPRLRVVHRLDKETSGLLVFARTVQAEAILGKQFRAHTVHRRYLAIVPGRVEAQTIRSRLVRDRGDGRRGSTRLPRVGKEAVTHLEVAEVLPEHTLVACQLETGRTHQIRIHLAELGHPICGERVYHRSMGKEPSPDTSGAPRLALHAAELGLVHPTTREKMSWSMPLPADLDQFLTHLRAKNDDDRNQMEG